MKTIFRKERKQPGMQRFRRRLTAGLLPAMLVIGVLLTAVRVAAEDVQPGLPRQQLAQETGAYWQLLMPPEVDEVPDENMHMEDLRSDVVCGKFTNSLSEGSFTHTGEVYDSKGCWNFSANLSFMATWSRPPDRIIPGTPLALAANVSKSVNTQPGFGGSLRLDISTDDPRTTCGIVTRDHKELCRFIVSTNDSSDNTEDCVLDVGSGRSAADQFALRYCVSADSGHIITGGTFGYRYVYQWVSAEEKSPGQDPGAVEDPVPDPPKPDPPKPDDSGTGTVVEVPSSRDSGSSSSSGSGSILGPLAVLGGLAGAAVIGGLAVLGGAVAAGVVGIKALGGGGGASAASMTAGGSTNVGVDSADRVADMVESQNGEMDHIHKPSQITREQLETEIQKELERLADEGHFVGNKSLAHKAWNVLPQNWISDKVFGRTNNYCEEMKVLGKAHLEKIMPEGTIIDEVKIERNALSNHIANKVILPDGTEMVIDYWEGMVNNQPSVYTVEEWAAKWEKELGQPKWGRYQIYDVVSDGQKEIYEYLLKNGYDSIDEFSSTRIPSKQVDAIKNWAKRQDWDKYETWDNIKKSLTPEQWEDWFNQNVMGQNSGLESGGVR